MALGLLRDGMGRRCVAPSAGGNRLGLRATARVGHRTVNMLGVVAMGLCSTVLGQDEDMPDAVKQAGIALLERALLAYNGRITVSGTVVDDSGNPLKGVRFWYSKSTNALDWTQMGGEGSTNEVVDRTFSIDVDNASAVTLHFSKRGYLPSRLGFSRE